MHTPPSIPPERLPALSRDAAFWGMTATQFLGAFNDNLFKQLVLLLCVDFVLRGGHDYQPLAMVLFAVPFVMFSGFGGYLSDRTGKRNIVVLCKLGEIVVMGLGMAAFVAGAANFDRQLILLFLVLFLMSTQSAFFGPAKYGILPEMLRGRDLPAANGLIQMTTFLAIIFGMALAGVAKDWFAGELWIVSTFCIGIAVVGTLTSLFLRKTPVARPGLPFRASSLAVNRETWELLRSDRSLLGVLLISSLFWFVGGAVQPGVNAFGKVQMQLDDSRTSLLAACMGIGIAAGCALAGKASRQRIRFGFVTLGAWGIIACLAATAWLGAAQIPDRSGDVPDRHAHVPDRHGPAPTLPELMRPASSTELLARLTLTGLGFAAGLFVVPLQVFLQARPPAGQKGRMIGTMNLINWIGIVLSAVFYTACLTLLDTFDLPVSWLFAALAVPLLPVALLFRPPDTELS